ncbi:MAG: sensor histidine kinase [Campylobacterota bacterium]
MIKRWFFSLPISTKLALSFLVVIFSFALIGGATIAMITNKNITQTTDRFIRLTYENNREYLLKNLLEDNKWALFKFVDSISDNEIISEALLSINDKVVAHSHPAQYRVNSLLSRQYLQQGQNFTIDIGSDKTAVLTIFKNPHNIYSQVLSNIKSIVIIFIFMALGSWLFAVFISRRILDRLKVASNNIDVIKKGEWAKIDTKEFKEKDEITVLLNSMNTMAQDIKSNIEKIEHLKDFYHNVLSSFELMVIVFKSDFKTVYCNKNTLAGTINTDFIKDFCIQNKITEYEKEMVEIKKEGKTFLLNLNTFKDNFIVTVSDITELKELEKKYSTTKSLAMLGEMSGFLSHELKNIISPLKLLIGAKNLDQYDIEVMGRSIKNMDAFINNFLTFAKPPQNENAQQTNLAQGVEAVLFLLSTKLHQCGISLHKQLETCFATIYSKAFEIIVLNLVLNAIDAAGKSGTIGISTYQEGRYVYLEVIDNGCGVPKEVQDTIFEPFFTTKTNGSGLGLALVVRIVDDMDGNIALESKEGQTRFTVVFKGEK